MKSKALIAAFGLAAALGAQAAGDHHNPKHGGVVVETKAFDVELVAKPATLQLHLRDHGGKAVDVSKSSAKLTLLAGSEKQEVELKPAGDKLEAAGTFKVGAGTKVVAVVNHAGKPATARFMLK
jgi:nitrogen fixation protein FixH